MSRTRVFWQEYGSYLAFGLALLAMLGSLYYSQIAGFVPCTLCWYQRILMYPLVLVTLVGIIKHDESLPDYVLPLSIIGIGVAAYHYLVQVGVFAHPAVCTVGAPCNLRWVNYFGFVTIPLMSLMAFVAITVVMALCKWASSAGNEDSPASEIASSGENDWAGKE